MRYGDYILMQEPVISVPGKGDGGGLCVAGFLCGGYDVHRLREDVDSGSGYVAQELS